MRAVVLVLLAAACASREPAPEKAKTPAEPTFPIEFEGNKITAARDLEAAARDELKSFQANGRRPADAEDATWAMEQHLRERGFAHGSTRFVLEAERLLFVVDEGPRAFLDRVVFEGVTVFGGEAMQEFFAFEGAGALGSGQPFYRQSEVDAAAQEIERFYLQSGYYEVRLGEVKTTWSEDKTRAAVTVPVTEGPLYTVSEVVFDGVEPRPTGIVGKPYHVRVPAETAARVRRQLLDQGRQFANVRGVAEIDEASHKAVVRITVDAGPVVRVGQLRIAA
ncbi:MAG: hypothetical protein OER88_11560, partial [Planctomycetota bacterium]|nr:hypothetical protein [Planctomycetota bacterium]